MKNDKKINDIRTTAHLSLGLGIGYILGQGFANDFVYGIKWNYFLGFIAIFMGIAQLIYTDAYLKRKQDKK